MSTLTIDLVPHMAKKQTPIGEVEVSLNQSMIFVKQDKDATPMHIGYVGDQPNAPINLIVNWGDDVNKILLEAIKKKLEDQDDERKIHSPVEAPKPEGPTDDDDEIEDDFDDGEEATEIADEQAESEVPAEEPVSEQQQTS